MVSIKDVKIFHLAVKVVKVVTKSWSVVRA